VDEKGQGIEKSIREEQVQKASRKSTGCTWMLHVAILEQRSDLLIKYLLRSSWDAGHRYILSPSAITQMHFLKCLDLRWPLSCDHVHVATLLLTAL
jgi:hypothetical protein